MVLTMSRRVCSDMADLPMSMKVAPAADRVATADKTV
jgi:hypothetical protein